MSFAKRMKEVQAEPEKSDEPQPQPCRYCGASTPYKTLAAYGARCFRCYEAYCTAHRPRPAWMEAKK